MKYDCDCFLADEIFKDNLIKQKRLSCNFARSYLARLFKQDLQKIRKAI